ncbi:MAG: serine hydrolase [Gammaproteobacteria bacterium]|nr:serine hydrolase [Gammaproteobacteria bacterium]
MRLRTGLTALAALATITVYGGEIPTAEAESVGMSTERLERIDTAMQRHIDAGDIQGAVTAVARRGKVVHFKAHGLMDVEAERPMERDAIFIMMSSTKPILGVAAMMMIEEGLIRPSDPVEKYIPEFADMQVAVLAEPADEDISPFQLDRQNPPAHRLVPAETPITIQHLLTHTSGLASGGLGSVASGPQIERVTLASFIPTLGDMALDFQPGSRWTYSGGVGLDVVARIIEIVSGIPYDEFVQTRILDPLEMTDTHYNLPAEKASRRVTIHGRDVSRWVNNETTYFSGSFGLSSTAKDYLHFEQMLANGGELFGRRLLGSRSVEMMGSNHLGDMYRGFTQTAKGQGFGYTVSVILDPIAAGSRRSAGAFGWGGAFGTRSWTDPAEELTGVIMLQQPYGPAHYDFENAVRQAIID